MKVGIDKIGFYTPSYFLDLETLAKVRNVDVEKFYKGLGQKKMSIVPPNEDIVTMGASAADKILNMEDKGNIDAIIFATESGFDYSKAASLYIHKLLKIHSRCRVFEIKQACYSGVGALQMGIALVRANMAKKVLVVASDIAYYGFCSLGESSQGAGAIAMLLTVDPRVLAVESESAFYTKEAMDFWRPEHFDTPIVYGKYSCELYLKILEQTWNGYKKVSNRNFNDHDFFCYHVPVPKLASKAHRYLIRISNEELGERSSLSLSNLEKSLIFNKEVGNCYTASLGVNLLALLETFQEDLSGSRVGLYGYGSGSTGEYFSAVVQKKYKSMLGDSLSMLSDRTRLAYDEYEIFYKERLINRENRKFSDYDAGKFKLVAIDNNKRIYEKNG